MKNASNSSTNPRKNEAKFNLDNKYNKFEKFKLRQVVAAIAENVGFSTASNSAISILTSLLRNYFEQLCRDSKTFAILAGDHGSVTLEDASKTFDLNYINLSELHDYLHQVDNFSQTQSIPQFPVLSSILLPESSSLPQITEQEQHENIEETEENKDDNKNAEEQIESESANKTDQRNIRIAQKTFPNFAGSFAPELGFTVQKIIPPTEEINIDQTLMKQATQSDASFTIIRQEHIVGPSIVVHSIPEDESQKKEKKRKKKEKREKEKEAKSGERKKHHHHHKEREEKQGKETTTPAETSKEEESIEQIASSSSQEPQMKVPKITIRIGQPEKKLVEPEAPSLTLSTPPAVETLPAAVEKKLEEKKIEEESQSQEQPTKEKIPKTHKATKKAKTPKIPSLPTTSNVADITIKMAESSTMASKNPPIPMVVPPLKIAKSPEKVVSDKKPTVIIEKEKSPIKTTQNATQMESGATTQTKKPDETPPKRNSADAKTTDTMPSNSSTKTSTPPLILPKTQAPAGSPKTTTSTTQQKKRSRKNEKPIRVDPSQSVDSPREHTPPKTQPVPAKAIIESITPPTSAKTKTTPMTTESKKLSEPPMTVTEKKSAGKTGRSSAQAKIAPIESVPSMKEKAKSKKTSSTASTSSSKIKSRPPTASAATTNLTSQNQQDAEEEQEEAIWICPVCSVAYGRTDPTWLDATIVTDGITGPVLEFLWHRLKMPHGSAMNVKRSGRNSKPMRMEAMEGVRVGNLLLEHRRLKSAVPANFEL